MSDTGRDESGKFSSAVTDEDLLAAFDHAAAPVLTAAELAEGLPIGRGAVRERLLDLKDRGLIARKQVGSRAVVWWVVDDTDDPSDEISDNDPLFNAPTFSTDEPIDEEDLDDILYGEVEG